MRNNIIDRFTIPEPKRIEVEMLRRCVEMRLEARGLQPQFVKVTDYHDRMMDEVVHSFCVGLVGHRLEDKKIEYPDGWWEAFKDRWFGAWLKRRYPVKKKVVVISGNAIYPEFKSKIPGERMVVLVNAREETQRFYDEEKV